MGRWYYDFDFYNRLVKDCLRAMLLQNLLCSIGLALPLLLLLYNTLLSVLCVYARGLAQPFVQHSTTTHPRSFLNFRGRLEKLREDIPNLM